MRRHPLVLMIALVAIVTVALRGVDRTDIEAYIDPPLLTIIVVTYLGAALLMLARTGWAYWTVLGAGLVATITADVGLYGFILAGTLDVERPFAGVWLTLVRSLLAVGGVMVLIGIVREWRDGWTREGGEA